MNNPKFYVLIPTRERADVLGSSLRTVTSQNYDNLEVIVSDNFSTDHTEAVVRNLGDPRVHYVRTDTRLSMSHNFEFALSHIGEGWVILLGDDDGLVPGALARLAEVLSDNNGILAYMSTIASFLWPGPSNQNAGRLHVPMRRGLEVRNSQEWLRKVVAGRTWYSELPLLYCGGLVHSSLIDKVREKRGSFFQSFMPDIFSAVALASLADRYIFLREPFAIGGHSKHSNSAAWAAKHLGSDASWPSDKAMLFLSEPNIPFHNDIAVPDGGSPPPALSIYVYESYLQAMYLHQNAIGMKPAYQLLLFLTQGIDRTEAGAAWVASFAALHGLDLAVVRRAVPALKMKLTWDRLANSASEFLNVYRVEPNFSIKMRDIHEASLIAGTVLKTRPNRVGSYINTLHRRARLAVEHRIRSQATSLKMPSAR